ncbi:antibiotic biosynthesis monooxygenase [Desmonostoc muscorum LEGE 12446]|uniref:antibiotic biosynthesis monooxygenase n=1 Tax=Desmonostoc muscorum TaxID=1179 RepID=UPI0018EFF612|nr:antibiotic biosynthesis monooxygenase [Desmonostoc muscorum]MCF2147579.1 antibiotic biosynthesis monooxygenase [Desmonostoc muscorum LEGE 12446]
MDQIKRPINLAPGVIAIAHRVKPGLEAAFEEATRGVTLAASTFPGYLGSDVLYPATKRGQWQLILRFDTPEHLQEWEESVICQGWIARAQALTVDQPKVMRVNCLEAWFALPEIPHAPPPPKWKTAIVSAVGLYPVISFLPGLLRPFTSTLPFWLANLVSISIMMPLMTWVIMPQVTRLFKGWLYPSN